MSSGFDEIIAGFSLTVGELAIQTRALIKDVMPGVVEVPWVKQRIIGYGVGAKKGSEHFCYISLQKMKSTWASTTAANSPTRRIC